MRKWPLRSDLLERNAPLVPYVMAVLLLPVLVLWHSDNALFAPPRSTDPWFYLGFFRTLVNYKRDLFPGMYYGSRLAWLLPGYLVHSLFGAVTANGVLHVGVHLVATLSFFSILNTTAGVRSAFLATMVFAVHPWLWCAVGWDYVDGPGVAWCLVTLALLTRAARRPAPKWSLVLAGMAVAGMAHTTLFLVPFTLLLPLYYAGMAWSKWRQTPIRSSASFALWVGAGFTAVTAALCVVNYWLDGNFWFWTPSLAVMKNLKTIFQQPEFRVWTDTGLEPCLWFPVIAVTATLILLPSRLKQDFQGANAAALLFSVNLLLAFAYMAYQQSRGMPGLAYYSYASFLLPFTFLAAGVSFWPAVDKMRPPAYLVICGAAAVMFGALWGTPASNVISSRPTFRETSIVLMGTALLVALALRQRPVGTWLALAGFGILTAQAGATTAWLHGNRSEYQRTLKARERVEFFRRKGVVRFWFDEHDPANLDYWALSNTYMAEFAQIGTSLPRNGCGARIDPGTLIVVSSSRPDAAETARRTLCDCWRAAGMKPRILAIDAMRRDAQPYLMILLRAEADPSLQHPLRVAFDSAGKASLEFAEHAAAPVPFPRERWRLTPNPPDPSSMESTAHGLIVRTPRASYAYAVEFPPLTVPVAGRYRFALRYRHLSGQFCFGAREEPDKQRYLATDAVGHPLEGEREMAFWLDLNRGESILLRLANNNNSGKGAASFVMGDVTAVEVDRDTGR